MKKLIALLLLAGALNAQDPELTNWRSGIDVTFGVGDGSDKGTAYYEEYFWYDKVQKDAKVVYIKDTTPIIMGHNARNKAKTTSAGGAAPNYTVGVNGPDGLPDTGDEGTIRYRWDRDRQVKIKWANQFSEPLFPAYTNPITLAAQQYGFGDAVNVVGATGSNGGTPSDYQGTYFRGVVDEFGDEWHSLTVADDSNPVVAAVGGNSLLKDRADDAKTILFVVNPKTPCFTARVTGTGQFFTTAPKAYWTPRVVAQTTYIAPGASGTVTIELRDINGNNVFYRINGGSFIDAGAATVTLTDAAFSDGSNTLDYYYAGNAAYTKTRTVVKNPGYPSDAEPHGYALFKSPASYAAMLARISNPATQAYTAYRSYKTNSGFTGSYNDGWYASKRQGQMIGGGNGSNQWHLKSAFVAKVDGFNYTKSGEPESYGQVAKGMLMDGILQSNLVGCELNYNADAIPNRGRFYRGYYDNEPVLAAIFSYDIMIANFKANQVTGGITPIEDLFIRDCFAEFAYCNGMLRAQVGNGGVYENPDMWGGSGMITAAIIAIIMPEYSSLVYGTSGVGTASATYYDCPFPNVKYTWAQTLLQTQARGGFPDIVWGTGISNNDSTYESLVTPAGYLRAGNTYGEGNWINKLAYLTDNQMGVFMQMYASVIRDLAPQYGDARLRSLFASGLAGTLVGTKDPYPQTPTTWNWPYLCNSSWPDIAAVQSGVITIPSGDFKPMLIALYDPFAGGADVTAPTLTSATIPAGGTTVVFTFSEPIQFGAGGSTGWTLSLSGGAVTLSSPTGTGTANITFQLSRTVSSGETGTRTYTQPGNGFEDNAGNDLASVSSAAITIIGAGDSTPPTVSIATPSGNATVTAPNYTAMAGTAADNTGVTAVLWSNNRGGSGTATGTTSWAIPVITLLSGDNIITVQSQDAAGNLSTAATRTITYNPPVSGSTETHTNPRNRACLGGD